MKKAIAEAVYRRARGYCERCFANAHAGQHIHHIDPKGMGGRKRTKAEHDTPENLILLCQVCHAAAHGLLVAVEGHSCRTCRRRATCTDTPLASGTDGNAGPA